MWCYDQDLKLLLSLQRRSFNVNPVLRLQLGAAEDAHSQHVVQQLTSGRSCPLTKNQALKTSSCAQIRCDKQELFHP